MAGGGAHIRMLIWLSRAGAVRWSGGWPIPGVRHPYGGVCFDQWTEERLAPSDLARGPKPPPRHRPPTLNSSRGHHRGHPAGPMSRWDVIISNCVINLSVGPSPRVLHRKMVPGSSQNPKGQKNRKSATVVAEDPPDPEKRSGPPAAPYVGLHPAGALSRHRVPPTGWARCRICR
jgi:hypothetical protein